MRRFVPALALVVCASAQQAQAPRRQFDVASMKQESPDACSKKAIEIPRPAPGRFVNRCMTLASYIQAAYVWFADGTPGAARSYPINGAPDWFNSDLFAVDARTDASATQGVMRGPMMQTLLEDRFNLKIRTETREVPVYQLTVAKGGAKLKPFQPGSCSPNAFDDPGPRDKDHPRPCRSGVGNLRNDKSKYFVEAQGMTLEEFAKFLELTLDRPVVNQTGLAGRFDFRVDFTPDESTPRFYKPQNTDSPDASGGQTFRDAIQDQLGLRLQPAIGPGVFLVVDHVEKLKEN